MVIKKYGTSTRFFGDGFSEVFSLDLKTILILVGVGVGLLFVLFLFLYFSLKKYKGHNRFLLFLRYKVFKMKGPRQKYDAYYSVKPRYLSPCEQQYFALLQNILKDKFFVFPQIPLSQLVEKHSKSNYKTELFRVIDFCVFDRDYYPLLCIEINDNSHLQKNRVRRDGKISEILKSARIPLLTLWTYEGINEQEIRKQLKAYRLI